MTKTVEFKLTPAESFLLNNILVEHCMSMVEVVNSQPTKEAAAKAMGMLKVSVTTQQFLFSNVANGTHDMPEPMVQFYRPLVESALEALTEVKSAALSSGDLSAFQMSETEDLLKSILGKIPSESRIIT